jgi:hypothetical protein
MLDEPCAKLAGVAPRLSTWADAQYDSKKKSGRLGGDLLGREHINITRFEIDLFEQSSLLLREVSRDNLRCPTFRYVGEDQGQRLIWLCERNPHLLCWAQYLVGGHLNDGEFGPERFCHDAKKTTESRCVSSPYTHAAFLRRLLELQDRFWPQLSLIPIWFIRSSDGAGEIGLVGSNAATLISLRSAAGSLVRQGTFGQRSKVVSQE